MNNKLFWLLSLIIGNSIVLSLGDELDLKFTSGTVLRPVQRKLLKESIDFSVRPCDNFLQYACGRWNETDIGKNESVFSMALNSSDLVEDVYDMINSSLLDANTTYYSENHPVLKAKEYLLSCMNIDKLFNLGRKPVVEFLRSEFNFTITNTGEIQTEYDWMELIVKMHFYQDNCYIFDCRIIPESTKNGYQYTLNLKYPDGVISRNIYIGFSGGSLPDVISQYLSVSRNAAQYIANEARQFEEDLSKIASGITKRQEAYKLNKYDKLNLRHFITKLIQRELDDDEEINIDEHYAEELNNLLMNERARRQLPYYLLARFMLYSFHDYIVAPGLISFGNDQEWHEICLKETIKGMNLAVANAFVTKYFKSGKRLDSAAIFDSIAKKAKDLVLQNTWYDKDSTKKASEKLEHVVKEIVFPPFILNGNDLKTWYHGVDFNSIEFFKTTMELKKMKTIRLFALAGQKVEKSQILYDISLLDGYEIPKINAEFMAHLMKVRIYGGILQLPRYHPNFPGYMKYGSIGTIIAHELFHALDKNNINYNADGKSECVLTPSSYAIYEDRIKCLIDQFDKLGVNGHHTVGENIADNAGIKTAYLAYMDWIETIKSNEEKMKHETIKGLDLTKEQLFFVSYAQYFCPQYFNSEHDDRDVHANPRLRVNEALSNSEYFANAFSCPRKSNCDIW